MTSYVSSHQRLRFLDEMAKTGTSTIDAGDISLTVSIDECNIVAPFGGKYEAVLSLVLDGDGQAELQVIEERRDEFSLDRHGIRWKEYADAAVIPDVGEIARLALEILPLLARVQAGFDDGMNVDAKLADSLIESLMSSARWVADIEIWAAEDWTSDASWEELAKGAGVSPLADDAVDIVADDQEGVAASDRRAVYGLREALSEMRDDWVKEQAWA